MDNDYTFMKTGQDNNITDSDDIFMLITLFTTNAIKSAKRHVDLSNRDGITKEDLKYGMIYETLEFLSNPNFNEELMRIRKLLSPLNSDDEDDDDFEDIDSILENNIIPDEEIIAFKKLDIFEISKIPTREDREFISKLYKHNENWNTWIPETPLETILYNAINKSY